MVTEAQQKDQGESIYAMLKATASVNDRNVLFAVEAMIEARDGIAPHELEAFAQRMSRRADKLERQQPFDN